MDTYFTVLGEIFNQEWLKKQSRKPWPRRHHIVRLLFGPEFKMPPPPQGYTFAFLVRLGRDLSDIKDILGFHKLIPRLRDKDGFDGARFEVEIAATLRRCDLEVVLFPSKGSDLAVRIDDGWVFIEVTRLSEPEEMEKTTKAFLQVMSAIRRVLPVGFERARLGLCQIPLLGAIVNIGVFIPEAQIPLGALVSKSGYF